jgi:hypothetical protein
MAANEYDVSAGLPPIDNSAGATANTYYISAGLPPADTAPPAATNSPQLMMMGIGA